MSHRWAYMRQNFDEQFSGKKRSDTGFIRWLNIMGEQGWELVVADSATTGWPAPDVRIVTNYCLFKRRGPMTDPMARLLEATP